MGYTNEKHALKYFNIIRKSRDIYKEKYDEAKRRRDEKMHELQSSYKPESDLYRKLSAEIPSDFKKAVKAAREEFLAAVTDASVQEEILNRAKVQSSYRSARTHDLAVVLRTLGNITMSATEVELLIKEYGNQNYCSDRLLSAFAERNGIMDIPLQPSIDVRNEVLSDIMKRCDVFLTNYGSGDIAGVAALHESTLLKLEKRYTNSYSGILLSPEKQADLAISACLSQWNIGSRSLSLVNALKTADEETRDCIVKKLRAGSVPPDVLLLFNLHEIVEGWRMNEEAGGSGDGEATGTERFLERCAEIGPNAASLEKAAPDIVASAALLSNPSLKAEGAKKMASALESRASYGASL